MSVNESEDPFSFGEMEDLFDEDLPLSPNLITQLLKQENLVSWYHLPIVYILKLCRINRQTSAICNRPDFWSTWFIANGIPPIIKSEVESVNVPSMFKGKSFNQCIEIIKKSLIDIYTFAIPFFQAFLYNPKFLFPGIEYFISKATTLDHAISLGDEFLIDHYITLLNTDNITYFDRTAILVLVSRYADVNQSNPDPRIRSIERKIQQDRINDLNKLDKDRFTLYKMPFTMKRLGRYIEFHLADQLGKIGDMLLFKTIMTRFIDLQYYGSDFITYTRIFAYYYGNDRFAEELSKLGREKYDTLTLANYLLDITRYQPGFEIPSLYVEIPYKFPEMVEWHIGRFGLFPILNTILSTQQSFKWTFNQLKYAFGLQNVIVGAMNANNILFLKYIFNASWSKEYRWWKEIIALAVVTVDPLTWKLVTENSPERISWSDTVWMGNRYDSLIYLEDVYAGVKLERYPTKTSVIGTDLMTNYYWYNYGG